MKHNLSAILLVFTFMVRDGHAVDAASDSALAAKFSPILILTEERGGEWGDIRVLKPERVEIVGAESADSIRFRVYNVLGQKIGGTRDWRSLDLNNWQSPLPSKIDFSQNRFAFLTRKYTGRPFLDGNRYARGQYLISSYFDYPGKGPRAWNEAYFDEEGDHFGEDFPNTAYVHIYETTHEAYTGSVTVIQYFYFYPYNHWWNRHEGDWQRVHVVVNSRNPNDAHLKVLGVEFLIHKAHLSYYRDFPINYNLLGQTVTDSG